MGGITPPPSPGAAAVVAGCRQLPLSALAPAQPLTRAAAAPSCCRRIPSAARGSGGLRALALPRKQGRGSRRRGCRGPGRLRCGELGTVAGGGGVQGKRSHEEMQPPEQKEAESREQQRARGCWHGVGGFTCPVLRLSHKHEEDSGSHPRSAPCVEEAGAASALEAPQGHCQAAGGRDRTGGS